MAQIPEPPIHDDDTSPSITIRPDDFDQRLNAMQRQSSGSQQLAGWISIIGAVVFTIGTLVLLVLPERESAEIVPTADTSVVQQQATNTVAPTELPTIPATAEVQQVVEAVAEDNSLAPVVSPQQLASLLSQPVMIDDTAQNVVYEPFTIVRNDQPRSDFIFYTAQQGDTVDEISQRYGLESESIAWCNDRDIVYVLRPGDVLRIPPIDGACHRVLGTREETIAEIAEQFKITDPFAIIDHPINSDLFGRTPTEILPGGKYLFIPEGEGELITWNPGYDTETDETGRVTAAAFAPGQAGSCGNVPTGGGAAWRNPLPNGTWVRGYFAGHTGIDLSASPGTPIYAANSGNVLFSGFSTWGYGNAVVLEHGPFSTLYGHMQDIYVRCGQFVTVGTVIGTVGSTGNSSGPHLHFEIRYQNQPQDPSSTPGIGW